VTGGHHLPAFKRRADPLPFPCKRARQGIRGYPSSVQVEGYFGEKVQFEANCADVHRKARLVAQIGDSDEINKVYTLGNRVVLAPSWLHKRRA
jgi:hypothetical protein